jgi:hypothetical protein
VVGGQTVYTTSGYHPVEGYTQGGYVTGGSGVGQQGYTTTQQTYVTGGSGVRTGSRVQEQY